MTKKRVTRLVVVDERGEGEVLEVFPARLELALQDEGQTLKIFVRDLPPMEAREAEEALRKSFAEALQTATQETDPE